MTRLLLIGLWISLCTASARASDLAVEWHVPAQMCPDREELRVGLSRRLQREVTLGADAPLSLSGSVTRDGDVYVLALHTRSRYGVENRSLRARTCNELARASVLIASLLFAREPASSALAPARDEETRAARVYARAQLALDFGTLPGVGFGPSVMIGARFGRVALELGGLALLPRAALSDGQTEAALQLTAAAASGCVTLLRTRTVSLGPCLQVEAGALHAEPRALLHARSSTQLWLGLGLGARVGIELTDFLYWFSELGAGLPWDRARFVVGGLGEVHHIPAVVGRFTTGLESRF